MSISAKAHVITPRVQRLLTAAHSRMLAPDGSRALRFVFDADEHLEKEQIRVESYRRTVGKPMLLRRAEAFANICAQWRPRIEPDEPIAGSQKGNVWWRGSASPTTPEQDAAHGAIEESYRELGIAFGEGHMVCDYECIIREGLKAQSQRIRGLMESCAADDPRLIAWQAMDITCEAARVFAEEHARAAEVAAEMSDPGRAEELHRIARVCRRVPWEPARSFREAMQSFWFIHVLLHFESPSVAVSPGRLDQYLYPYYRQDIDSGALSHDEAAELMACLWLKFWEGDESQNVTIGGTDAGGQDATNELSYLVLDITRELGAFQPSVSVRVHPGGPHEFLARAVELSATGTGQPSFFNDTVVRQSLKSIGVPAGESWDWAIVGCYEAVVAGAEWGRTVAGGSMLPDAVMHALQRRPDAFAQLMDWTREELCAGIDQAVDAANNQERHEAANAPSPFQSVLMRDCIGKGLDIYSGGALHNYSACWLGGLASGVDSLVAVGKLVFDEQTLSLDELLSLLERDFDGAEEARQLLVRRAPKFGNDIDEVDRLACELGEFYCREVVKRRNPRGGIFQPSLAMYQTHYRGLEAGATPDGRHAHTNYSAGIAPTQGRNEKGVTATLASCAKLPHYLGPDGNFLMISMPPATLAGSGGLDRLSELISTYFQQGGSHIMVNVVDADTLRDARTHPENHRDLMVRISGLSAYFVTLPRHIQDDIIERTEQGL